MDFISNLIKRPISLVLNDAVPTTEQMQNSARSNRSQTPPSPLGRGVSPPQNGHCIAAGATAISNATVINALRLSDEFLPIAAPIRTLPSPPASPSALLPCLHSNSSSTHSNSVTSNTIEELLIQINDSLNEATISDGAATENHNKSPVSTPSPIALSTVELSLKSAGLKLPPSPRPKETPATSTASTTVAMAPAANAASAEEATLQSLRSKAGLFDGLPFQLNHNTGVNTACTKFVGLTEFDESSIPELPGHLNPNIEEHLKLTFEEGLIPTLTANINQQQQQLNSIMQKDDINNKAHQQLFVPNESDTAVSSDSEIFAECQSYQDGIINISSEYMGDEFNTENSGMDAFFSAANSRNTTITNVITNPLDTTIEMALQAAKTDAAAYSSQQEERLEACSPTGTAAIATVDSTKLPGEKPLVVEEAKPLEPHPETTSPCLVNVTFGDEPMDVDMSLTQEQFLQSGALDLEAPSPNDVNSAGDSPVEEAVTAVKTCDHNVKSTDTVENEAVGSNSTTVSPSLSNADGNSLSASAGSELEIHQSKHEVSLNKSVELPAQHSEKNSFSDCVLQDNKVGSSANDLNTASPITDATQIITTASAASSLNASDEDCKEYVPTKVVEVAPAEMTASQKSLAEATGKVNISAEMDSSISSSKSSTCSSSSFPIKRGPNDLKQFPRSPTKVVEKEMAYLEKSEYTERKEIERKKSLATEIKIVPTTPPKEVENENEATTLTPADLNSTIDLCTPQSDKFAMSPTTPDTDVALNSTFNDTTSLSTPGATAMSERKSEDATSPSSRNTAEAEMQSPPASLNESDKKTRRTFNVPPLNKSLEQRRTFNVSPTLQVSHQNESSEPMDVDDTLPLSSPIAAEPPSIATIQREGNEKDAATIPSQTLSTSPPIPTLMNHQLDDAAQTAQPPSSTITTSPPIPTLMNRQRNAETLLMMPPVPKTVPVSPPVPALMKRELVAIASQSVPSQPSCQRDEATLMMPPPPPPSQTTIYSPPVPTLQKRPPIHPTIDPFLSTEIPEALSAKEQTKSNASDEKDVFAGNSTPSPMEDAPSVGFSGFGDGDGAVGREEFNDADFQSCNNLILNPSDFDYLLTKGNNNAPVDRSSILLRFDPLLGVPVAANQLPPIKPAQPLFQQILGNNALCLSPTLEEDEAHTSSSHDNSQSFVVEHKNRSFETNSAAKSAKLQDEQSAKVKQEYTQGNQPHEAEEQNPAANTKKDARMSVDVIKDMNVDNDCNKSFENSNSQSDEKQINYKMDDLEKKIKNEVLKTEDIEKKLKEAEQREEALIKRITEKDKTITKMNGVIEAYEKAIAELIAEKEQLIQNYEKQLSEVKTDRDSNYQHLTSLETTFSDLHVKYEKSKEMTLQLKSNEEVLLAERRQILENLRLQEQRYDKMKNHAMQQLEIANKKLETLNKEHSVESTKLKALLKKEEISRASINEQLQQKSRENAELVKICDELINGQGS